MLSLKTREVTFIPSTEVELLSEIDYRYPLISSMNISVNNEYRTVHTILNVPKIIKKLKIAIGLSRQQNS